MLILLFSLFKLDLREEGFRGKAGTRFAVYKLVDALMSNYRACELMFYPAKGRVCSNLNRSLVLAKLPRRVQRLGDRREGPPKSDAHIFHDESDSCGMGYFRLVSGS